MSILHRRKFVNERRRLREAQAAGEAPPREPPARGKGAPKKPRPKPRGKRR